MADSGPSSSQTEQESVFLKISCSGPLQLSKFLSFVDGLEPRPAGDFEITQFPLEAIKIQPTEKEKLLKKQLYRKEYVKRPAVMKKIDERRHDKVVIARQQEYARKPEVQQRKKILASARRMQNKQIKTMFPNEFKKVHEIVFAPLQEILEKTKISKKRSRSERPEKSRKKSKRSSEKIPESSPTF